MSIVLETRKFKSTKQWDTKYLHEKKYWWIEYAIYLLSKKVLMDTKTGHEPGRHQMNWIQNQNPRMDALKKYEHQNNIFKYSYCVREKKLH